MAKGKKKSDIISKPFISKDSVYYNSEITVQTGCFAVIYYYFFVLFQIQ